MPAIAQKAQSLNDYLMRSVVEIADDHLILGHRLSQWCGHAPMLEEDLSMPNMALDLIGQSRSLYSYAAKLEGAGRSEDDLAFLRSDTEYTNCLLVERGNEDFAHTMLRQFYFAAFMKPFWQRVMAGGDETLQGIAGKAVKEITYHIRHAGEWLVRMGDGTAESAERLKAAIESLHPYTSELFWISDARAACVDAGLLPSTDVLQPAWNNMVSEVFTQALVDIPEVTYPLLGGRQGKHTEEFGHLLAELQYMQRTYPGAQW